ncbi:MAG TPA: tyrosine--tRNA ligase [Candidatus Eisenbacteria bacterium]|nr:tyrosine--tRNA ligase [Candidatus Eisenbacteria bacterium]
MTSNSFKTVAEQLAYLKKGVAEIIPEPELKASLEKSLQTGKPLRVYLGVDPTAPDLHLGHTVVLRKLKHFQDLGHTAVFLIGDFSAMIGDPTGVSETRPPLTREQVDANAKTYLTQVFKILDPAKTEVRYNSEWLSKLSAVDIIHLCGRYRLARMLEREDFRKRLEEGQPISVHELLYPLLTALDAVELKSDVELGATEQKFNLLVHREIQREYGLPGQAILTMPILVGLDGQRKMSKSLGNYIGITEPPAEMFGKIMSIPDELMWTYYELVTDRSPEQIAALKQEVASGALHPMDAKMRLGEEVASDFHGAEAARKAAENFQRVFRDRQAPAEMKEIRLTRQEDFLRHSGGVISTRTAAPKWIQVLAYLRQVESVAEAARLIKQGAVEIDGQIVSDETLRLNPNLAASYEVRVGKKKFLRIVVE